MGIEIETLKGISGGWSVAARLCDSCKSVAATVFCRADSAFLCIACDTSIHSFSSLAPLSRHERVWVCEVCEQAPAAVTCKADAAALCVTCDADIHSANPLARRHERVPVEPFFDSTESAFAKCSASTFGLHSHVATVDFSSASCGGKADHEDLGACSWLMQNDFKTNPKFDLENMAGLKSGDVILSDFDRFIEFKYNPNSIRNPNSGGTDGLVPVQLMNNQEHCFDIDFCKSKLSSFSCPTTQSLSHSISSSSLDFGVVPDRSGSISELSRPLSQKVSPGSTAVNPSSAVSGGATNESAAQQLCGIDREARVLRYREKRKNRKFEKTIRYASRKAYAESRPRVKGRFAKRTDAQNEAVVVGGRYASARAGSDYIREVSHYGVVPSC